jgi:hypothetical protein
LCPAGNPSVDEDAIGMDSRFDSDRCIGLLPYGGADDRFGDGIG